MNTSPNHDRLRAGGRKRRAGILVLESLPTPRDSQLRAFVWSQNPWNRGGLESAPPGPAPFRLLMVGLPFNGGDGHSPVNGDEA